MNFKPFHFLLFLSLFIPLLNSCFSPPKLEKCKLIEVEPREIELDPGDIDIEGWELEVLCQEQLWDIPWREINRNFKLDLKQFYSKNPQEAEQKVQELSQRLVFYKQDNNKNLLYGSLDGGEQLGIKANRDD